MIEAVKKSKDIVALLIIEGGSEWGDFIIKKKVDGLIEIGAVAK